MSDVSTKILAGEKMMASGEIIPNDLNEAVKKMIAGRSHEVVSHESVEHVNCWDYHSVLNAERVIPNPIIFPIGTDRNLCTHNIVLNNTFIMGITGSGVQTVTDSIIAELFKITNSDELRLWEVDTTGFPSTYGLMLNSGKRCLDITYFSNDGKLPSRVAVNQAYHVIWQYYIKMMDRLSGMEYYSIPTVLVLRNMERLFRADTPEIILRILEDILTIGSSVGMYVIANGAPFNCKYLKRKLVKLFDTRIVTKFFSDANADMYDTFKVKNNSAYYERGYVDVYTKDKFISSVAPIYYPEDKISSILKRRKYNSRVYYQTTYALDMLQSFDVVSQDLHFNLMNDEDFGSSFLKAYVNYWYAILCGEGRDDYHLKSNTVMRYVGWLTADAVVAYVTKEMYKNVAPRQQYEFSNKYDAILQVVNEYYDTHYANKGVRVE